MISLPLPQQEAHPLLMNEANVERLAATLCRLRGAALKVGQMLSFNDADVLPPAVRTLMERVRNGADWMPAWQLEETMRRELGDDPGGMRAKYLQLVSKTRTGRDGTERVTLATGEYSAATIFNRSYAWVCAASANVDMMAARVSTAVDACRVNREDASLRDQLDAARLDLEVRWPRVSGLWCCAAVCMPALWRWRHGVCGVALQLCTVPQLQVFIVALTPGRVCHVWLYRRQRTHG